MIPALVLYSAGIVDLMILAKRRWPKYVFLLASKCKYEQQYMWWCSCNTWLAMTIPWWRPAVTSLPPSSGCISCWLLAASSSSSPSVCSFFEFPSTRDGWLNQPWRAQIQWLYVCPAAVLHVSSCSIFLLVVLTLLNFNHVWRLCTSQVETGQGEFKTTRAHLPPQAYHTRYTLAPLTLIIIFSQKKFRKLKEIKKQ
jgi:hypothetical protein